MGIAHDVLGPLVLGSAERDTHARGYVNHLVVQRERFAQRLVYALGHANGIARAQDVVEEDGELVAPDARDSVAGTQAPFESVSDLDQQLVADEMP
jgi:hypothetical protein